MSEQVLTNSVDKGWRQFDAIPIFLCEYDIRNNEFIIVV